MNKAHALPIEEVLTAFNTSPARGLTSAQAIVALEEHGRNEIPRPEPAPLWKLVLQQFEDRLVLILLASAVVSFALALVDTIHSSATSAESWMSAFVEPAVIVLILIANATVGVIQESNAEKAIEALQQYTPDYAQVIRDGISNSIQAALLVPGDIVQLQSGNKVPADCRLLKLHSASLTVDQALLTGESYSVSKDPRAIVSDTQAVKQDMINMLFSGTTVTTGKCEAIVVQTGTRTAIGDIHTSITQQISEKTPLKQKLDDFGDLLAKVISVICILVWLINIRHFNDPAHHGWVKGAIYYFKIAVALAVAAIPEGLAVVITTCLALGTSRMAQKNAIVRTLPSVETLGCTSVICSDKTGTLTTNMMSVTKLLLVNAPNQLGEFNVTGASYAPVGDVIDKSSGKPVPFLATQSPAVVELSQTFALVNESSIVYDAKNDVYTRSGEPTEAALKVLVEKLGSPDNAFNHGRLQTADPHTRAAAVSNYWTSEGGIEKLATLDFTRSRRSMSAIVNRTAANGSRVTSLLVKGGADQILERSSHVRLTNGETVPLTTEIRGMILAKLEEFGRKHSLRLLAAAVRDGVSSDLSQWDLADVDGFVKYETGLTLVGIAGMMDPPRPEVREAIMKCRSAGIRVVVVTGDNKHTAESIARKCGVFGDVNGSVHDYDEKALVGRSFTGREFDSMTEREKLEAVRTAVLFSRVEPAHKLELVELLQQQNHVVAMTGDGVNDAPALKRADIGISMGSGTDVAKLASDMVLADDNFATIERAVEEGRSIYANTKQFIRYLISSNIGEVVSIFLTVLLGMPEALIPVQLLWVNLVTDGLPATALGFNKADHEVMRRPPRGRNEPIVNRWLFVRYMIIGTYVGVATVFGYAWWFMFYSGGPQISAYELTHFHQCSQLFPHLNCSMFDAAGEMAKRATAMSLSILVTIEMFNAMNSLSENESLLQLPLWSNMYLVYAIVLSMVLHFVILYVPFFATVFSIMPLNWDEWKAVIWISLPVLFLDEGLKYLTRSGMYKHLFGSTILQDATATSSPSE